MSKEVRLIVTSKDLSASFDSDIVEVGDRRRISFATLVTQTKGANSSVPTSSPVGAWALWFSHDRTEFFPVETTDIVTEMTRLNPTGNNLIRKSAIVHLPPGKYLLARYARGSGGGAGANCEVWMEMID